MLGTGPTTWLEREAFPPARRGPHRRKRPRNADSVVARGNTVAYQGRTLQLPQSIVSVQKGVLQLWLSKAYEKGYPHAAQGDD